MSGAWVVLGFTCSFRGAGISFGGVVGLEGAVIAGPVWQPVEDGAEQLSHEFEFEWQSFALRRLRKPILLEQQSPELWWKPVNNDLLIIGVLQAGAQATGAQGLGQATGAGAHGAGHAGSQLFLQLNFARMRANRPKRGPQWLSQEATGAAPHPPQPVLLTTTAEGAAAGAGAASAPAIHAELRIKNVAFTVEPPRGKGGRVVVWRRTIAPLVPVLPRGKSC